MDPGKYLNLVFCCLRQYFYASYVFSGGSPPSNLAEGFERWQAGKPVRKTKAKAQDENDENDVTNNYTYVRRDGQPAPQGRKRKTARDSRVNC